MEQDRQKEYKKFLLKHVTDNPKYDQFSAIKAIREHYTKDKKDLKLNDIVKSLDQLIADGAITTNRPRSGDSFTHERTLSPTP